MLLAACLLLTLIDFSLSQAQYTGDPNETYSLMTVLASQPILTAFAAALANYTPLFNLVAEGNCTILAPSENASDTFASQTSADELEAIVSYSILQGVYTPVDFQRGLQFYPTYLTNPNYANVTGGQRVGAYVTDGGVVFESGLKIQSHLVTENIVYAGSNFNGVIHIVDRVLQIPLDAAKTGEIVEFSGVVPTALKYPSNNPELIGVYGPVPDWTAFAPNSSAGAPTNLDQSSILDDQAYHFVQGSVFYSPDLQNGTQIKTLEGHNLTITVAPNGTKYVNDVAFLGFDYLTSTGVFHVIDHILDVNRTDARPVLAANITANTTIHEPGPSDTSSTLSSHSSSLGSDAKAGIGIGVILGAAIAIGLLVWWCIARRKRRCRTRVQNQTQSQMLAKTMRTNSAFTVQHEMSARRSGLEWEMDGVELQRPRPYHELP